MLFRSVIKYFGGTLPGALMSDDLADSELISMASGLRAAYEEDMEKYSFQTALAKILTVTSRANKYIDDTAPWIIAKDESQTARLAGVMYNVLETIRLCTILLKPFMPKSCEKIFTQIGVEADITTWDSAAVFGALPKTAAVSKGEIIFPRIDMEKELDELEKQKTEL